MNMKLNRSGLSILTVVVLGSISSNIYADAYRNPAPTAEGIAKAGANMIFSDDASAISYNPANLAFQTNTSVVLAVAFARAENTYSSSAAGMDTAVSDDPWAILPNLYVSMPVTEGIVAGLGITTPYGQGISWNSSDLYNPSAPALTLYDAEIALININPTIAIKLGDSVSVGLGADIYYSQLEFSALIPVPPPFPPSLPPVDAKAEGDGWGIGGNIGVTWEMTEKQRIALTYRSQVNLDYEGDFSLNGDFAMDVKYPNTFEAGYGIQATDTLQLEAMLQWSQWSINDTQTAQVGDFGSIELVNNWEDSITVAIGGIWQFSEGWVFRTGYSFIETPIPDSTLAPTLPDTDRHVIGLGLGYTIAGHSLDLSYGYTIYEDRTSPPGSAAPGTYEIDSNLVGLTYSASF